jgi:class 3 adenylate cyclase
MGGLGGTFKLPVFSPEMIKVPDLSLGVVNFPDFSSLHRVVTMPTLSMPTLIAPDLLSKYQKYEAEVAELRRRVEDQAKVLHEKATNVKANEKQISELKSTLAELEEKERIGFLLRHVNEAAQRKLLASAEFRQLFLEARACPALILSVDIRRSTELMLKAKSPEAFAEFITALCAALMGIITESFGVFDKFTGDGVLAFFPAFYSGEDAAYYAVSAADKCHASFREHYRSHRRSFSSVLTDIGLGIGIDYGPVHLVQMAGSLTVVGAPVVYASRLSSAPPGVTLVNQPAYEVISDRFGQSCLIGETAIEIKHEGNMLAYDVKLNTREFKPESPHWLGEGEEPK